VTDAELDRLRQVAREQAEIEISVRAAIAEQERAKEKRDTALLKHPLLLLLVGSLITAMLGSWFSTKWQLQQWRIQQRDQRVDSEAKDMRQLQRETTEAVADSFAAAEDVLHLFFWEWSKQSKITSLSERGIRWVEVSRKWRVKEKVLTVRLRSSFGEQTASAFINITADRRQLGNKIILLLSAADVSGARTVRHDDDLAQTAEDALRIVNDVSLPNGKLAALTAMMESEILTRQEQRQRTPPAIDFFARGVSDD